MGRPVVMTFYWLLRKDAPEASSSILSSPSSRPKSNEAFRGDYFVVIPSVARGIKPSLFAPFYCRRTSDSLMRSE